MQAPTRSCNKHCSEKQTHTRNKQGLAAPKAPCNLLALPARQPSFYFFFFPTAPRRALFFQIEARGSSETLLHRISMTGGHQNIKKKTGRQEVNRGDNRLIIKNKASDLRFRWQFIVFLNHARMCLRDFFRRKCEGQFIKNPYSGVKRWQKQRDEGEFHACQFFSISRGQASHK